MDTILDPPSCLLIDKILDLKPAKKVEALKNVTINEALKIMSNFKISGVPVVDSGKLIGILTNRDIRFETNYNYANVTAVLTVSGFKDRNTQGSYMILADSR